MSATGNDYAELYDLGPTRWSSRGYYHHVPQVQQGSALHPSVLQEQQAKLTAQSLATSVPSPTSLLYHHHHHHHLRVPTTRTYQTEDLSAVTATGSYGNSTNSLRTSGGRSELYYSPPGTSYTILERPHSPHYYYNSAGVAIKSGSLPGRGVTYLSSSSPQSSHLSNMRSGAGTLSSTSGLGRYEMSSDSSINCSGNLNKKRPLSPEQVLRMFGATQSFSVPTSNYHYNGIRDRERTIRRSPASSPPSTTHQIYRDRDRDRDRERSVPNIHELSTRSVTMSREQHIDHGFGICVKGGKDTGLGVYISRIEENSIAERAGLRPGDTILEVNGTPFTSVNHEEALKKCVQILKSSRQISMTVRSPPILSSTAPLHGFGPPISSRDPVYTSMVPPPLQPLVMPMGMNKGSTLPFRQTCSWMDRHGRPASPPMEYGGRHCERRDPIRRVELLIEPGQSLGLMIRGGIEYGLGIFVTGVDKDSVADRAGLMVGDEILEVNGQSFQDVTHDEAVSQLKHHKAMSILIRDVGKVPHSCTSIEMEPWDAYSPAGSRARRKGPIAAMVEEKACSLLPRHHYASLSYYIAEYSAKAMTIDAFVAVLLEMLNTHEKHTLVTEIRELIFPEDRARYDELVYRRKRDPYNNDRLQRKPESGRDLPINDMDVEINAATGRSPSSDSGLGMQLTDIKYRPILHQQHQQQQQQLPYRPMSAEPILHRSPQLQQRPQINYYYAKPSAKSSTHSQAQPQSHEQNSYASSSSLSSSSTAAMINASGNMPAVSASLTNQFKCHHASLRHLGGHSSIRQTHGSSSTTQNTPLRRPFSYIYSDSCIQTQFQTRTDTLNTSDQRHIIGINHNMHKSLPQSDNQHHQGGYLDGLRSHLGGLTQRVKSWYWGRPLELATQLSRSFDIKQDDGTLLANKNIRRHQSMQRLTAEQQQNGNIGVGGNGVGVSMNDKTHEHNPNVVPDHKGNLYVTVKKTKPILGIAIEGGANTKHPLPRIINIHENGAAFDAGGLEVGQLILEVDGKKVDGLHHQEVARLIAECFANREKSDITFLVVEAKKSNLEPKPTALIFLEA